MVLATNITRRSGSKSYYARIVVPRDIKKQFGKTEESDIAQDTRPGRSEAPRTSGIR